MTRGIDLEEGDQYYDHEQVPAPGQDLPPDRLPAVRGLALHERVPDRGHLAGAGRHRGDRLRLVHRLPLLHGGVPLRRASLQLGRALHPGKDEVNTEHAHRWAIARARGASWRSAASASTRVRNGRYPACLEACPVGARKFGNLLDPNSEIRYLLKHKRTFVLKAELATQAQVLLLLRLIHARRTNGQASLVAEFWRFTKGQRSSW